MFRKSPEDRERAAADKQAKAFLASPAGQARQAFLRGDLLFQCHFDVMDTKAAVIAMSGAYAHSKVNDPTDILNAGLWFGCCECAATDLDRPAHRDDEGRYMMCHRCYRYCRWGAGSDEAMWDPIIRFWETRRKEIRRFRRYMSDRCELCRRPASEIELHPHHWDGDHRNNRRENCQTLCIDCHHRIPHDHRSYAQRNREELARTGMTPGRLAARARRRIAAQRGRAA